MPGQGSTPALRTAYGPPSSSGQQALRTKPPGERVEGPSPVAHRPLRFGRRVGQRHAELVGKEEGVVAESMRARSALYDSALYFTARRQFTVGATPRGRADETRPTLPNAVQPAQQLLVIGLIERGAVQIRPAAPPLAAHSRLSAERVHDEPGIIGHHGEATAPGEEIARLRERVLLERLVRLDRLFVWRFGNARFGEIDHRHAVALEDGTQLAQLSGAARREHQHSVARQRPSAPRWRASSSPRPRVASSRSRSSSARSNVPFSPVPCTSTNLPSLLITTFMSTSATTSSEYSRSSRASPRTIPTLTPATRRRTGDRLSFPFAIIQSNASTSATHAPVIAAVRVPPSACNTSQSTLRVYSPHAKSSSIARTLRPMSRWISWVRPPICPRSRAVRVEVARGSIAYSAVSQPSPRPRRHPGTPSSTDTAQSTRVWPKATRQEPSAFGAAPRSSRTSRRASAVRPARVGVSVVATQRSDDVGSRLTWSQRDDHNATTPRANLRRAHDRLLAIVAALDEHVGAQALDRFERCVLLAQDHAIDHLECREHVCALRLAPDRTARPLQAPDGVITVDGDDERITMTSRAQQHVDVPWMQQVEDAVREDDAAALRRAPPRRGGPVANLASGITRRCRARQKIPSACGLKRTSRTNSGSSIVS